MAFSTTDTIAAVATPPGRGGLGVVRLSGPAALAIAVRLLGRGRPLAPRRATFGRIVDAGDREDGVARPIEQVVATWFEAPHSFTGEDVVEISGHGSPILLKRVLELALAAGARLAEPGEFTLRAHLNGRLDLVQAEAIADLVDAVTPLQARAAMDQLEGTLTAAIGAVDARLFDLAARLEASLDFPDEGFHFITREEAADALKLAREALESLAGDGRSGRVIREGRLVVIAGRPNAGKSSLFNALAGAPRAIVTDIPGTTRDALTEQVEIGGIPVTLVDTAGLREANDVIEAEGVRRAEAALKVAALTLFVADGSNGEDLEHALNLPAPDRLQLLVVSKSDLPASAVRDVSRPMFERAIKVSAVTGEGLDRLRSVIVSALTARDEWRDPPAITNVRHLKLVEEALASLECVRAALEAGATEELVLAELGHARRSLEEITGRRTSDDLLAHIFSRFCVGK